MVQQNRCSILGMNAYRNIINAWGGIPYPYPILNYGLLNSSSMKATLNRSHLLTKRWPMVSLIDIYEGHRELQRETNEGGRWNCAWHTAILSHGDFQCVNDCGIISILLVLKAEYYGETGSIHWFLICCRYKEPGHQQPRYYLCTINASLVSMKTDWSYPHHIDNEKW